MSRYAGISAVIIAFVLVVLAATRAGAVAPGNPAFQRTWDRTDQPVSSGAVARTWIWGPEATSPVVQESYAESPGGSRQVQYFDKSRMEINNPDGDPQLVPSTSPTACSSSNSCPVSSNSATTPSSSMTPPQVNVAGDPDDPPSPTPISRRCAPLLPLPNGSAIVQRLDGDGAVSTTRAWPARASPPPSASPSRASTIRWPSPFWAFMNSTGPVWINGQRATERLFDPCSTRPAIRSPRRTGRT